MVGPTGLGLPAAAVAEVEHLVLLTVAEGY